MGPTDSEGRYKNTSTGEAWEKDRIKSHRNRAIDIVVGIISGVLILIF